VISYKLLLFISKCNTPPHSGQGDKVHDSLPDLEGGEDMGDMVLEVGIR